jgi:hypothetical protein
MSGFTRLTWILGIGLCCGLQARASVAGQGQHEVACGASIRTREVLVLDLEHLRGQPEAAIERVSREAGQYRLASAEPEEFRMRYRASGNRDGVIRRAGKLGAQRGCDLVVLLKTGPYFGRQRGNNPRIRDGGYALVVMGQRTGDDR